MILNVEPISIFYLLTDLSDSSDRSDRSDDPGTASINLIR